MDNLEFKLWYQRHQSAQPLSPLVMGILNVTPDSFSDGGKHFSLNKALRRACKMIEQGVDIIDVGGESTRPGSQPISLTEELERVIPIIEQIRQRFDTVISIDTNKAKVMESAVQAGAYIINDITALNNLQSLSIAQNNQAFICLMHMQNTPDIMQNNPVYPQSVIETINDFFEERIEACLKAGISKERLILDPGFGFGKTIQDNLTIIKNLTSFQQHQRPLLIGVSRKSTVGKLLNKPVNQRLIGSLTLNIVALLRGINIVRTHDILETRQAITLLNALDGLAQNLITETP